MRGIRTHLVTISLAACITAAISTAAIAQTPTGTIAGVVTDLTGAAVPNATVTITSEATNVSQVQKTDANGRYTQPFLNPGQYKVQVEAPGFTRSEQDNITVDVALTHPVDIKLAVGSEATTVTVQATTPALETDNATTGQVITGRRILDLPLNGRNPFALATLVPGVNNTSGPYGASTPSFAGSRNSNNEQELDGITNILPENNVGNNSSAYTPIVDSVDQFNVQTSVETPEYGRFSGGLINLATRTGTNRFHGSLFEFNRDAIFDATDDFATTKPPLLRNQAGGTFGGPLIKDRTFFFLAGEISRETDSATETDSVATQAERNGDFSQLLASGVQLYDPHTAAPVLVNGTIMYQRQPYANNQIPASQLSPAGQKILSYQPLPNVNTSSPFKNYVVTGAPTNNYYHFDVRLDHNWSEKWKTFVRFSHYADNQTPFADYPADNGVASQGYNGPQSSTAYSLAYDNTFTLSPKLLLDVRYGFSRSTVNRIPFGGTFDLTQLGLPSSLAGVAARQYEYFPNINMGNGYSGIGSNGYVPLLENPSAHDLLASITKIAGGHQLKFGGEFRKLFLNFHQYGDPSGSFSFSNSWTEQTVNQSSSTQGNPFADLLLGLPDGGYQTNDPTFAAASEYYALYAQDTWRVTGHFTLSYGLRWDMDQPRTERHNQLSYWNPLDASPIGAVTPAPGVSCPACGDLMGSMHFVGTASGQYGRQQINAHKLDFGPRLGAVWSPDDKWAVRAGFGIVFAPSDMQPAGTSGAAGTEGFSTTTNAQFTLNSEQTIFTTLDNPFPTGYNLPAGVAGGPGTDLGNGISQSYLDDVNSRTPYSEQANLTVQRSLPGQTIVEIGYLYNQGQFLVNGDPGVPHDQVDPSYLGLGSALLQTVPNPFYGVITTPGSPLAQPTIQRNYLLRPFPQYNGVTEYRKDHAYSNYNAITARLDKRFAQGLTILVSYTGAKLMDNSPAAVTYLGPYADTYENQYNPSAEYSVSPQDINHQLVSSYTYELPFGAGRRFLSNTHGLLGGFVKGWQTSGIISYVGGNPVIVGGINDNSGLFLEGARPGLNTFNLKLGNPTRTQWFNNSIQSANTPTGAWIIPAQFTLGNAPRTLGNVRTPRYVDADLSAIKNTYFGADQRFNLELRFEAFNALNHAWLAPPDSGVNDGDFGQITSTATGYSPRNVQLAAKFVF